MESLGLQGIFDIAGFSSGINEYTSKLGAAAQQTDQSEGIFGKLGNALGGAVKVGAVAAIGGVTALAGGIIGAASAAGEWGDKLDSIGDILGTTAEQSAGLAVAVERVGGNATDFANNLVFLGKNLESTPGKLGKSGEALKALGISAYDSNGQLRDSASIAADVATKVALMPDGLQKSEVMMNIFGKSGKDLSDVMTGLANGGLANATQQAKEYGLAMSDDAIAASIESGKQMKQLEQAVQGLVVGLGTQLLPIILPIAKELIGLAMGALPSVRDAIGKVMAVLEPVIEALHSFFSTIVTGIQGGKDPFVVISGGLSDLLTKFGVSEGVINAVTTVFDGFAGVLRQLFRDISQGNSVVAIISQAISGLGEVFGLTEDDAYNLGDTIFNALTPLNNVIDGLITTFGDLFNRISLGLDPIFTLQGFVADLGMAFGLTEDDAGSLATVVTTAFTTIKGVVETDINAVMGIINSLLPIIASLQTIVEGAGRTVADSLPKMQEIFTTAGEVISGVIKGISDVVQAVFGEIAKFLDANGDDISGFINETWNTILDIIEIAMQIINKTIVPALNAIAKFIQDHSDTIQQIFQTVWDTIKGIINVALALIKGILKTVLALINGDTQGALDALEEMFNTIWDNIKGIVNLAINAVKTSIETTMGTIKSGLETTWGNIKTGISTTLDSISGNVSTKWDEIKNSISTKLESARADAEGKWNSMKSKVDEVIGNIQSGVSTGFDSVKNTIVGYIGDAIKGINDKLSQFYNAGKDLVGNIVQGVKDVGKNISDTIGGFITTGFNNAMSGINSAIDGVKRIIQGFWDAITAIRSVLDGIKIPGIGGSSNQAGAGASYLGGSYTGASSVYNTSYSSVYNLNVTAGLPVSNVQQQFAIMEALAAG